LKNLSNLRLLALDRADHKCEWPLCNNFDKKLEMAHITGIGMGGRNKKDKFDINNVVILCKLHHDIYDGRTISLAKKEYRQLLKSYLDYERQ
jgi:predicted restriction endonuclease